MDYTKPMLIPAGSDALGQIGRPASACNAVNCLMKKSVAKEVLLFAAW